MNLTIEEIKEVIKNQSGKEVKSMQLLLAEDLLKMYEKLEEAGNERK